MTEAEKAAFEYIQHIEANPQQMATFAIPPHLLSAYLLFGDRAGNSYLLSTIFMAGWRAKERSAQDQGVLN